MVVHPARNQISLRFLVPTLLLCCGAMLAISGVDASDLRAWLDQAGPWAPIAFILAGIASMSVMVPKTVVSMTAGALFGTLLGSLLLLVIAVIAAALNYAIGRWWLLESIDRKLSEADKQHGVTWAHAVRDVAAEAGFRFHFLIRLTPVPTTIISYVMGAAGSRIRPFLLAAAVAVIPQALWVHGGTAAVLIDDPSATGLRWVILGASVTAAVAIAVIVPRMAIKRVDAMRRLQTSGALD